MSDRALSAGEYLLGAAELGLIVVALAFCAVRLRRLALPGFSGSPALVADAVATLALATVLAELLGTFDLFTEPAYPGRVCWSSALSARSALPGARQDAGRYASRRPRPTDLACRSLPSSSRRSSPGGRSPRSAASPGAWAEPTRSGTTCRSRPGSSKRARRARSSSSTRSSSRRSTRRTPRSCTRSRSSPSRATSSRRS